MSRQLILRQLGTRGFPEVLEAMRACTDRRDARSDDELWALEHPPVYTLGQAGRREHIVADPGAVPVIETDRGGQVTYHGPGQLVMYTLLDLRRLDIGVRTLVRALQSAIISVLDSYGIDATTRAGAPGVYVAGKKIAALGLRVRRGCTYHGLSFNVAMDLAPFERIDPCGYPGLAVTQLSELGVHTTTSSVAERLADELARELGYNDPVERGQPPAFLEQGVPLSIEH